MEVRITNKYIDSSSPFEIREQWDSMIDCPLARALRDQHPDFPFSKIYWDASIVLSDGRRIFMKEGVWDSDKAVQLGVGEISEVILKYPEKNLEIS